MSEHVAYCTNAACSIHMPLPDNPQSGLRAPGTAEQGATGLDDEIREVLAAAAGLDPVNVSVGIVRDLAQKAWFRLAASGLLRSSGDTETEAERPARKDG